MKKTCQFLVGIDSGGTKIDVILASPDGSVISFATGKGGIPRRIGHKVYLSRVKACIKRAYRLAGVHGIPIVDIGASVAGLDWDSQRHTLKELFSSIPGCRDVYVINDVLGGLIAGAESGWGIGLVAGTGCNCRGLSENGKEFRVIGTGDMFAEYGGATSIVMKAVQAIGLQWARVGQETLLADEFMRATKVRKLARLIEMISVREITFDASFAKLIFKAADAGDTTAISIIDWASDEIVKLAERVAENMQLRSQPFELVLIGSLFRLSARYCNSSTARLTATLPTAKIVLLPFSPALGGVLITRPRDRLVLRDKLIKTFPHAALNV